jgi:hypothetical protein
MSSPQAFEFVSDASVAGDAWETDGLPAVRNVLSQALTSQDSKKAQQVVYEACWRVIRGEVSANEMIALFVGHEGEGQRDALAATLADVCW